MYYECILKFINNYKISKKDGKLLKISFEIILYSYVILYLFCFLNYISLKLKNEVFLNLRKQSV